MTRTIATWIALWLALASAVAVGVLVGSLLATVASASRPALASPSPSGELTSSSLPGRTGAPTLPTVGQGTGVGAPSSPLVVPPLPTARRAATISGIASWYDYRPRGAAAGPALRAALGPDWRGRVVTVSRTVVGDQTSSIVAVRATLTDFCQCYRGEGRERVIDLDRETFAMLATPSRGLVKVEVSW